MMIDDIPVRIVLAPITDWWSQPWFNFRTLCKLSSSFNSSQLLEVRHDEVRVNFIVIWTLHITWIWGRQLRWSAGTRRRHVTHVGTECYLSSPSLTTVRGHIGQESTSASGTSLDTLGACKRVATKKNLADAAVTLNDSSMNSDVSWYPLVLYNALMFVNTGQPFDICCTMTISQLVAMTISRFVTRSRTILCLRSILITFIVHQPSLSSRASS